MMLSRLDFLFLILQLHLLHFALAGPSSSSSSCPRGVTGLLFSTPPDQLCRPSARFLFRSGRTSISRAVGSGTEDISDSGFDPGPLELGIHTTRPQAFALEHGAPNAAGGTSSSQSIYKSSQAVSIFWHSAWLVLLLYLLATTASDYFTFAVEELSVVLRLSPAVAGVTLLAFGTGAPDVFSSAASFLSSNASSISIGFSSALGGALFVTTVVTGTVSLVAADSCVKIDLFPFLRDTLFLLFSVGVFTAIAVDGKVHLWEAIVFLCIYAVYVVEVGVEGFLEARTRNFPSHPPAIEDLVLHKVVGDDTAVQPLLPFHKDDHFPYVFEKEENRTAPRIKYYFLLVYKYGIELPLAVPRRLTIPVVEEERWCRPLAVASCVMAPIFLVAVWVFECNNSGTSGWIAAGVGGVLAVIFGLLAGFSTENSRRPERFLWVWLLGSFVMSIVWTYLIASEVVETLSSLGTSFQTDTDILSITILAWGNSIGDFVTDLTLACRGSEGVQIAFSGCYAGPLFVTVFGMGISLVAACSTSKSSTLLLGDDASLFYISGFLAAGLIWALLILPLRGMRPNRTFGAGLVLIYVSFLAVALCYAMGWIPQ